tara:strand:- start:97 stop:753 length:657 start_codon:yes stop_codon:yes gene_type:complete
MLPFVVKDEVVDHTMHIESFFPTPIGFVQMDKTLNKKILEIIKIKQFEFIKHFDGNNVSSDFYILDNDEFSDIKKVLTDSVNEYFKEIVNSGEDMELYITTSCINVTKNGEMHPRHNHANSIVSAVLYIDTCERDAITIMDPNTGIFGNFRFTDTHPTSWVANAFDIPVKTDTLIMFPSTLPHQVKPRPNTCTGTRISLAFNTWIKGRIGSRLDALMC